MQEQEKQQIFNILANLEVSKKYIPYFSDVLEHPIFGGVMASLDEEKRQQVIALCDEFVIDRLSQIKKTKGGQLFYRFFESQEALFWRFRRMNDKAVEAPDFQNIGAQVETEMFKLEGILTEKMFKQEKGLDTVISSFYNLVFAFFPKYNQIGIDD